MKTHRPRRGRALYIGGYALLGVALLFVVNGCYQVLRKPTELLGLVGRSSPKSLRTTWEDYGALFRQHSTELMQPELLAALVQVETGGAPLARTYWRWRWSWNPLEIYAPASTAAGILQMTDGFFTVARRYCIHDHAVAREGRWDDWNACWLNALYSRPIPSHSIEMTSAYLHQAVVDTLSAERVVSATLEQKQRLVAVIHLCGRQRGGAFARRGFRVVKGEGCGAHDLGAYLSQVQRLARAFGRLEAPGGRRHLANARP